MTTISLVSPSAVSVGVADVVTVAATVSDSTRPVFYASDQSYPLATSKNEANIWTATWAAGAAGAFTIKVTAGDADPVEVAVTVAGAGDDGGTPGDYFADEVVAALIQDETPSSTRSALSATYASLDDDGVTLVIGGQPVGGGGGSSKAVDKVGVYIPEGSLPRLRTANPTTELVELTYFGDSTGKGAGGNGGPVVKVRSLALAAGFADGGIGVVAQNETAGTSGENLAPLVSKTGFAGGGNSSDFLNSDGPVSSAAGDSLTFQGKGTAYRIHYAILQGTTGRFRHRVDGGAWTTVDASTATDGATTATIGTVTVTGLAEGTHQVQIENLGDGPVPAPSNINGAGPNNSNTTAPSTMGPYQYVATVRTATGETTPTAAFGPVSSNTNRSILVQVDARNVAAITGTSGVFVRLYRRAGTSGAFAFLAEVPIAASNSFTSYDDNDSVTPNAAVSPPSTNGAGFVGTTKQCRPALEFIRATGLVIHKQAVSGTTTGSWFDATRSTAATQPNAVAQAALGLTTGLGSKGADWRTTPAAKPASRNVRASAFALGLNDANVGDEATYLVNRERAIANFTLFVRMCRAANADPILVVEHFTYYSAASSSLYQDRLRADLAAAARAMQVAYVDYNVALGPASTGPSSGEPHLAQAAYDSEGTFLWTELLAPALAGDVG